MFDNVFIYIDFIYVYKIIIWEKYIGKIIYYRFVIVKFNVNF